MSYEAGLRIARTPSAPMTCPVTQYLVPDGGNHFETLPLPGSFELVEKPRFLPAAHHTAACIVRDLVNVMSVPIQISDGPVVVTSIKHDEIKQCADRKASPNPQVVVHLNLPNRHPLKLDYDFGVSLASLRFYNEPLEHM